MTRSYQSFRGSYYSDDSVRSEEVTQAHDEFSSEEVDRFCTTSKDIVNNVVVSIPRFLRFLHPVDDRDSVPNDRCMVSWEIKILCSKIMHYWIDLNGRGMNSMSDQCSRGCTDSYPSETQGQLVGVSYWRGGEHLHN